MLAILELLIVKLRKPVVLQTILPCFSSLDDDFPDNVSQSRQLWEKVGQAWIFDEAQRDSRMKDRIDFQCEQSQPRHYPADG